MKKIALFIYLAFSVVVLSQTTYPTVHNENTKFNGYLYTKYRPLNATDSTAWLSDVRKAFSKEDSLRLKDSIKLDSAYNNSVKASTVNLTHTKLNFKTISGTSYSLTVPEFDQNTTGNAATATTAAYANLVNLTQDNPNSTEYLLFAPGDLYQNIYFNSNISANPFTGVMTTSGYKVSGGTSSEILMADGSLLQNNFAQKSDTTKYIATITTLNDSIKSLKNTLDTGYVTVSGSQTVKGCKYFYNEKNEYVGYIDVMNTNEFDFTKGNNSGTIYLNFQGSNVPIMNYVLEEGINGNVWSNLSLNSINLPGGYNVDTAEVHKWNTVVDSASTYAKSSVVEYKANKGINNGYASLDAGGKVPVSELPSSLMIYKGLWDASVNNPTLNNSIGISGWVYQISMAKDSVIRNYFGQVDTLWNSDYVMYNGSTWEVSGNDNLVRSVNGQQGIVTLTKSSIGLGNVANTAQVTSVSAGTGLTSSGGTTPTISIASGRYLPTTTDQTNWNLVSNKANLSGANFTGKITAPAITTNSSTVADSIKYTGYGNALVISTLGGTSTFDASGNINAGNAVTAQSMMSDTYYNGIGTDQARWKSDTTALTGIPTNWHLNHSLASYLPLSGGTVTGTLTATSFTGAATGLTGTAASLNIGGTAPAILLTGTALASNVVSSSLTSVGMLTSGSVPYSLLSGTVPTWNQNTTGTASNVTGTVAITNGGTGATSASGAISNLGGWSTTGNSGLTAGTNFIGTTDNTDIVFKLNNIQSGWINYALNNVSLGTNSMTSSATGVDNTALGSSALRYNTTGSYNTAVGTFTLTESTTGSFNTAIGISALYNITTGSFNTAIGGSTLSNTTTGTYNTAVGMYALTESTTGSYNTAIGISALYNTTTGTSNTAIGGSALSNTTTGTSNTAVGLNSMYNNSTGSYNVSSGVNALINNTTGSNNTAIGLYSLSGNAIGNYNTAIGSSIGAYIGTQKTAGSFLAGFAYQISAIGTTDFTQIGASANTVGLQFTATGVGAGTGTAYPVTNNNITIGYACLNNSYAAVSNALVIGTNTTIKQDNSTNEIVIGNNLVGNGSNTVTIGNSSTTNNYFNGAVNSGSFVNSTNSSTSALMSNGSTQVVTSGTYTPTLTASTGTSSVTLNQATYHRTGNIVHINVSLQLNQSATTSNFSISLPSGMTTNNISQSYIGSITALYTSSWTTGSVGISSTSTAQVAIITTTVGSFNVNIQFDYIIQ